jgi:tetratricopeptide (TPR) repeat protein
MRFRFHAALIAAALALAAGPALAQQPSMPNERPPLPGGKADGPWLQPPSKLPQVGGDRTKNLDLLFKALKAAPSEPVAKAIETRIWAVWAVSRSDTTMLLMGRVRTAVEKHDVDLALKLLDAVVKIKPDYVEAWNRRATIYFLKKDYGHALSDIREVLKHEPRHFGALSGMALILQEIGDDAHALDVYRRVLAIYPKIERVPDIVKKLEHKVQGRDI